MVWFINIIIDRNIEFNNMLFSEVDVDMNVTKYNMN